MTTARTRSAAATAVPPGDLAAALRAAGLTGVDDSARRRAEYSSDASNYRVVPSVVVFPRHADEVVAALDVARRAGVPVTSRGGGTSIAGNSVGSGVVLDFSRHLNRVLSVDPEARTALAEPGAILDAITAAAAGHGLRFGPDPSSHSRASIGGAIGNNACGSRALRYGRTADNVVSLDLLTASGERMTARRMGRDGLTAAGPAGAALDALVEAHLGLIRTEFGRFTRQVSGYSLEHLLPENGADIARFLAGTEGTLAVVTGATVALVPSPKAVALAVLGYPGMPEAAEAVPGLLPHRPVAMEGLDARLVGVFRARRARRPSRPCRAVSPGCSSRPRGTPRPRRAPRPGGSSPTPAASTRWWSPAPRRGRCGASGKTARAWAAAPPTTRRPGPAGRTPPSRPSTWVRTCVTLPRSWASTAWTA